ncbi:MAG: TOBE domain-containing protein, partial [Caldilineaceae bacterium]|nr:TOBE domain-containing protein [Caldilineaceae bacterium]
ADRIALMNAGHIEQLAAPSELYANPATLFAADFIGAMNLLKADVDQGQLQMGRQRLPMPEDVAHGQAFTVAIRPEDLAVLPADTAAGDGWLGNVEQTMDMGHYRKVLVSLDGIDEPLKAYIPKVQPIADNESVKLYPQRYLVYEGGRKPVEMQRPLQ